MKDTVTEYQFIDTMAQKQHGFSYQGAKALFEYFEQYEQDCDMEIEFDPVGIRCDFDEYENLEDVKKSYQILTLSTKIENRINEITKDFDRAMLEDLIVDWQKSPEKYPYLKYLKKKRKEIK